MSDSTSPPVQDSGETGLLKYWLEILLCCLQIWASLYLIQVQILKQLHRKLGQMGVDHQRGQKMKGTVTYQGLFRILNPSQNQSRWHLLPKLRRRRQILGQSSTQVMMLWILITKNLHELMSEPHNWRRLKSLHLDGIRSKKLKIFSV